MADLSSVRVLTADRVPLELPAAGLGERGFAYFIDVSIVLTAALTALFVYNFWGDIERDLGALSPLAGLFALVVAFALVVGYDVLFEVWGGGQTLGKRVMKIRVVRTEGDGAAPDLLSALMRNALRLLDFLPAFYATGTVALFITGTRRLGDLVSGCAVVKERVRDAFLDDLVAAAPHPPRDGFVLDDAVLLAVESHWERGVALTPAARSRAAQRFAEEHNLTDASASAPLLTGRALVAQCYMDSSLRRSGHAAKTLRLHKRSVALETAIIAFGRTRTLDDARVLDAAIRDASAEMGAFLSAGAPQATHRIAVALLRAEHVRARGAPQRERGVPFWTERLPRTLYAERALIARCAAVMFSCAALAFALAFVDANIARALLGEELSSLVDAGAQWTNQIEAQGQFSRAAVTVILNNVRVGFLACGFGLLGGVGTLLLLGLNGLHLGAVFGYAVSRGEAATLFKFIAAHGPVELLSVCVAGAAGLAIGRAIISPGPGGRLEALRREGQVAAQLLVAATCGFLFIGTVEGVISPGALFPWPVNLSVGILTFGAVVLYVQRYGRGARANDHAPSAGDAPSTGVPSP